MNKLLYIIILCMLPIFGMAQEAFKIKGKPNTLEECFIYLDQKLDSNIIQDIKKLDEDSLFVLHFGFGMWLRNHLGLWKGSKLSLYFQGKGVFHPDDMSSIIILSYHRYLNKREILLEEQLERYHKYYEDFDFQKPVSPPDTDPYMSIGIATGFGFYNDLTNLNRQLTDNDYPSLNTGYFQNSFSLSFHKHKLHFNCDFLSKSDMNSDTANVKKSNIKTYEMQFDLGYDIYSKSKYPVFIFGGYYMGASTLSLENEIPDTLKMNQLGHFTNSIEVSNGSVFSTCIGVGISSSRDRAFHWNARIGYQHMLMSSEWHNNNVKLGEMPSIDNGGFFVKLMGFVNLNQLLNKVHTPN